MKVLMLTPLMKMGYGVPEAIASLARGMAPLGIETVVGCMDSDDSFGDLTIRHVNPHPPLVLDLALFFDLASRAGMKGIQEWLSFYFKSPQHAPGLYPEHDLFIQLTKLKNTLRWMMGEEVITHLGREYYTEI